MKKIIILFVTLIILILTVIVVAIATPFYTYEQVKSGKLRSDWYSLDRYDKRFISPNKKASANLMKMSDEENWQNFHFQDLLIPLPVRNPFYFTAPILNYYPKSRKTETGIELYLPSGRAISELKFIPIKKFGYELKVQKLFQLPLVKRIIKSFKKDQIWKDIFTKDLSNWRVSIKEMLYNLYLIQMRSILLPSNFTKFQWLDDKEQLALVTIQSENKDFTTEVIMKKHKSTIYSYLLLTRTEVDISQAFRSKFLNSIRFRDGHPSLSNIIYREFKGLRYDKKIDHEGMLYLLSAWSHNMNNKQLVREMIEYLERGDRNQKQLLPIYRYAVKRWGTTFSVRYVEGLTDEQINLQRSIELEQQKNEKRLLEESVKEIKPKPLKPEDEMHQMLQRAKKSKNKKKSKSRMIID